MVTAASHLVLRKVKANGITYQPGERIDATNLRYRPQLEDQRTIRALFPHELADQDAAPAALVTDDDTPTGADDSAPEPASMESESTDDGDEESEDEGGGHEDRQGASAEPAHGGAVQRGRPRGQGARR